MLIDLGSDGRVVALNAGELLCSAGVQLDSVYQIRSGELEVMSGELRLATLTAPALVGDISAIAGGLTTADVRAIDRCEVAQIPIPTFNDWLADHPDEAAAISATARERADHTRAQAILADLVGHDSPAVINEIAGRLTWLNLNAGDLLFAQGDEADAAYIVITGRVHVRRLDVDGATELDVEVGRGALVGELGIIEDQPRSASIRAIRDTTLARLSKLDFDEVTALNPTVTIRIVRSLLERMQNESNRSVQNRLVALAVTDPAADLADVAETFVEEVRRFGTAEYLTAELADAVLGRPGMTESPVDSAAYRRLADLLHESEAENDYVIVSTHPTSDRWTNRAVRSCDRLVVVTSPRPGAEETRLIEGLLDQAAETTNRSVWIVRRYPTGSQPYGAGKLLADERIDDVLHVPPDPDHVRRIARLATGNGIGVVFGGGGGRGFAHLGACQAIEELGVPIDAVAGASIGAVIGGVIAQDIPTADRASIVAEAFHDLLDYTLPVVALLRSEKITANIEQQFGSWQIENTWLPYTCVTTNLTTASIKVHDSGSLGDAIRASVAIPGVLPPVTNNGELLVDGGVLENLPIDGFVADDRISTIIVLDVAPPEHPKTKRDFSPDVPGLGALWARMSPRQDNYPTIASTIIRSLLVAASRQRDTVLASGHVDLYVLMNMEDVGLLDFEQVPQVAAAGYEAALPQVRAWVDQPD